ncbi:beta-1,6-N-acetylglucosaminyltransferase [Chryseobacterium luquanense]|uniref:Peptide O-xylosyltransferase n=1 Tax=Chryseobacterium luquanense TaxID=2983766 RepID=A0ABT3Y3S2_9FLAO|nr:beta-1,6-N-acetylglucosaminyltransferase [Chryseobacterium luquanense]MCX8532726.1 beta-1,6-N-acetylglucosaminyltransferase [Chryseobacterium luquanense]
MKNVCISESGIVDMPIQSVSIAYLILVHRLPNQFKKLFKAIYDSSNFYLIHIDKKASQQIGEDVKNFLKDYLNVHILDSENVIWGGYSMVQAELDGMKYLLEMNKKWDYFINLSGQDFPLKSQEIIKNFLSKNNGKNYIKIADQEKSRPETMNRIENYFEELEDKISDKTHKRDFMKGVIPYIGGQWMILTRNCCEFITNNVEVKKFEDYYLNTLIADESFFQTVLMNTSFAGTLINDDKRAIIWIPDGDIKLRPKTFTQTDLGFLLEGNHLFARKFDNNVDNTIIESLKTYYDSPFKEFVEIKNIKNNILNVNHMN